MWKKIAETVANAVFPRRCLGCGQEGRYICQKCDLFALDAPVIFPKGNLLEELISGWEYNGLIKDLIHEIKYAAVFDAIDELVEKIFVARKLCFPQDTVITFVPMFRKRERERGFNQAELIARKVGSAAKLSVVSLLEKVKDMPSQTELDKKERLANVYNAFRINQQSFGQLLSPAKQLAKNILLVDDVWTSGATLQECAKVLKRAGAKRIFGFTLARTV